MDNLVVQELVEKTFRELSAANKPQQHSRVSQTPNGYIFLVAWSNASLLRILVRTFTETLPKSKYRLKVHLDDAARSVVANIEEGYGRPTTSQYLDFLGFSQGSLREVKGDVQRCLQDGLLSSRSGSSQASLGISLKDWHEVLKRSVISLLTESKGVYRNLEESRRKTPGFAGKPNLLQVPLKSFKFLYSPVDNLRTQDLTYEIFVELINKTDWHLRKLAVSLEDKLGREQKFYLVEQARIRSNLWMK